MRARAHAGVPAYKSWRDVRGGLTVSNDDKLIVSSGATLDRIDPRRRIDLIRGTPRRPERIPPLSSSRIPDTISAAPVVFVKRRRLSTQTTFGAENSKKEIDDARSDVGSLRGVLRRLGAGRGRRSAVRVEAAGEVRQTGRHVSTRPRSW